MKYQTKKLISSSTSGIDPPPSFLLSNQPTMPPSAARRGKPSRLRRGLCCSFSGPHTPDRGPAAAAKPKTTVISAKPPGSPSPNPSSPPNPPRSALARRILSPGRVSPLDPPSPDPRSRFAPAQPPPPDEPAPISPAPVMAAGEHDDASPAAVRLHLRGFDGGSLLLELDSGVLRRHSAVLAEKMGKGDGVVEVPEVRDLGLFKETLELMYEKDAVDVLQRLRKVGIARSIDILEVSTEIKFSLAISSCLNYLEAVPWTENEEEKLKSLFAKCNYPVSNAHDILARLYHQKEAERLPLAVDLVVAITKGTDRNATKELKTLVRGLLSQSSVYQKDPAGITKEALYRICESCLCSLVELYKQALSSSFLEEVEMKQQPLIGLISKQVENINWLLEVLIDKQVGEDFVSLWADQNQLINMHSKCSPLLRYELSRISAYVFIALGKGKLHCRRDDRYNAFRAWFGPMLCDFGWLRRCSKGLDVRDLEDAMGQALLTLPLVQQQNFFMDWFECFSKCGSECPNLSAAFQIWWRRWSSRSSTLAPSVRSSS